MIAVVISCAVCSYLAGFLGGSLTTLCGCDCNNIVRVKCYQVHVLLATASYVMHDCTMLSMLITCYMLVFAATTLFSYTFDYPYSLNPLWLLCHPFGADCAKPDPEVSEEMGKNFIDLLAEELKLKEEHATEGQHRADVTLLEAKKLASQYQKEADKCSSGMDTCEEARERAEAALLQQKKLTALWAQRARQRGWRNARSY